LAAGFRPNPQGELSTLPHPLLCNEEPITVKPTLSKNSGYATGHSDLDPRKTTLVLPDSCALKGRSQVQ